MGYDKESTNAHRIYWPDRKTVGVERNIRLVEDDGGVDISGGADDTGLEGENSNLEQNSHEEPQENKPRDIPGTQQTTLSNESPETQPQAAPLTPTPTEDSGRPKRQVKPSAYVQRLRDGEGTTLGVYRNGREVGKTLLDGIQAGMAEDDNWDNVDIGGGEFCMGAATQEAEGLDPTSLKEAQSRSDWPKWQEAMKKELESLKKNGTWDVVPRPPDKNIVGSKWVFHIKRDANGSIEKYKARLVARGFTQIYGVDYTETFAPVARMSSLRTILALAARNDWPIEVFDFNSAFLNSKLDEDIFMQLPPGSEGSEGGKLVAHLRKALYGLKQGGRAWYSTLKTTLEELGFTRSNYDHGVFYLKKGGLIILAIHVDDCTITGTTQALLDDTKRRLNVRYALTDLGPIYWLLGIKVTRNRAARTITLSQRSYIESILRKFNFTDLKPVSIPMEPGATFLKTQCPSTPEDVARMRSVPY